MTKQERHPELYELILNLKKEYKGRISENRGHIYSLTNNSRVPKIEIGVNKENVQINLEGISNLKVSCTTNKKYKWAFPIIYRDETLLKTFYLKKVTTPTLLSNFIRNLTPKLREILIIEANWFNIEDNSIFLDINLNESQEVIDLTYLLSSMEINKES